MSPAATNATLQERKELLDDAWLLTLLGVALAVGGPWFMRTLPIDIGPATWAVFVYGAAQVAVSRAIERLRGAGAARLALTALQAANLVFLAILWHLVGGVQNPMFLMVFAIPIAAAGYVLPGARPFGLVILAVACTAAVALADSPELRWYLTQLGVPSELMPREVFGAPRPFPGLDVPAAALFVMLSSFAALAFALALVAHSMALQAARMRARLDAAASAAGDASALASQVLRAMPMPCALVYADTLHVAQASESFVRRLGLLPEQLGDQGFLDLVAFTFPEVIREAIARGEGDVPFAVYRADGTASAARVCVSRVDHAGTRYALVAFEDIAERFTLQAAMGAVTSAVVVIGDDDRVRYFNPAAHAVLPGLEIGLHAATSLAQPDGAGWWRLGERGRRDRQVHLDGRSFQARCVAANAPGRQDRLTVVELVTA